MATLASASATLLVLSFLLACPSLSPRKLTFVVWRQPIVTGKPQLKVHNYALREDVAPWSTLSADDHDVGAGVKVFRENIFHLPFLDTSVHVDIHDNSDP